MAAKKFCLSFFRNISRILGIRRTIKDNIAPSAIALLYLPFSLFLPFPLTCLLPFPFSHAKKTSPSQRRRSEQRKIKYEQSKILASQSNMKSLKIEKNDNDVATQIGAEVLEIGVNTEDVVKEKVMVDAEIQEKVHTLDKETTTEEITLENSIWVFSSIFSRN